MANKAHRKCEITSDIETCFEHVDRLRALKKENLADYRIAIRYLEEVALGEIRSPILHVSPEMAETILWELDEDSNMVTAVNREIFRDLLNDQPQEPLFDANAQEDQYMAGSDRFVPLDLALEDKANQYALQGYEPDED